VTKPGEDIAKFDLQSENILDARTRELLRLFPEAHTESGGINFDVLRSTLGEAVNIGQEGFGMSWPGKAECSRVIQRQSIATLLPALDESINWDTTQNAIIEGDNLEVLKVLQKSYLGKVKMIYIDPPYNTGNDFIYPDNYTESLKTYLQFTGQIDSEGQNFSTNTESNGRFHTKWLNLMYPRLSLARDLLSEDGVIFISIDDNEFGNLKKLCELVFGEENYLNTFVWISNLKGRQISGSGAAGTKEYVLAFSKNQELAPEFRVSGSNMKSKMPSVYRGFEYEVEMDDRGPYVVKNELYNTNSAFNEVTRKNLVFDIYFHPKTKAVKTEPVSDIHVHSEFVKIPPHKNNNGLNKYHAFRWSARKVVEESYDLDFVETASGWKVYTKVRDVDSTALKDLFMDIGTSEGSSDIKKIGLDPKWFDYPKPVSLIKILIEACTKADDIILDFFAGSGTTGQAVLELNLEQNSSRRFILVQLPEKIDETFAAAKAGFETIASITRERVRKFVHQSNETISPSHEVKNSLGFRSFKLASSNFALWDAGAVEGDVKKLEQQLFAQVEHVVLGRTNQDVLFELLLKSRYDLFTPIESVLVGDCEVWKVAGSEMIAVIDKGLTVEVIREIAAWKPTSVVILDRCFAGDDSLKANARKIFEDAKVELKTV
jgi:adenine-specific DNA-methyltransferase